MMISIGSLSISYGVVEMMFVCYKKQYLNNVMKSRIKFVSVATCVNPGAVKLNWYIAKLELGPTTYVSISVFVYLSSVR